MTLNINYELEHSNDSKIRIPCTSCDGRTTHKQVSVYRTDGRHEEEYGGFVYCWTDTYEIVQCLGCDLISFRMTKMNSEDIEPINEFGETAHSVQEELYPSRVEGFRGLGKDLRYLPGEVRAIYDETLRALTNQSPILTGIGLRALLETVCKEKQAKGSNLLLKIDDLSERRFLNSVSTQILHEIRTLGNRAAHNVSPNTEKQLGLAMTIVEHLLRDIYILPKKAKREFNKDFENSPKID